MNHLFKSTLIILSYILNIPVFLITQGATVKALANETWEEVCWEFLGNILFSAEERNTLKNLLALLLTFLPVLGVLKGCKRPPSHAKKPKAWKGIKQRVAEHQDRKRLESWSHD